ncbi:MAG TPA: double-strand break repair helicase AddA [Maritimibacter sp.]|nr:double-strand break repair helicase AddA [Maritimibacter sp.]
MIRDDATAQQIKAASPTRNTWLSANAGSGKTRVLTDRVARLLLSNVEPQNILCLTYTKAAASEMQNRLFQRLGEWAMLDDETLIGALRDLGVGGELNLLRARQLFARAIETPGGLKIQTIHAFCASILRRFPMEAGVAHDFQEMDDRSGHLLRDEVLEQMAEDSDRPLVEDLVRYFTGADIDSFLQSIIGRRHDFQMAVSRNDVWDWLELDTDVTVHTLIQDLFTPDVKALIPQVVPILRQHSKTMIDWADRLASLDLDAPGRTDLDQIINAFLTKGNTIRANHPTGKAASDLGALAEGLMHLGNRVFDTKQTLLKLDVAQRTLALHQFAHQFVHRFEAAKAARGWLDFDDLIHRTSLLLNDSDLAQWVLYRLDGGIDHILVDESQDTSPEQWRVIRSIAREFMSGEGAHGDKEWSIFVVGDPKQSIYSFQGADPAEFQNMRAWFGDKLEAVLNPLQDLPLRHSFRSSPAILDTVDVALKDVAGLGETPDHAAFHAAMPGRVDLWPFLEKEEEPKPKPWNDPVDLPAPTNHDVLLAQSIREEIARMIEFERVPKFDKDTKTHVFKPVTPGDIIVLVQRRSPLFHHLIRECKSHGIPVAGADRLKIAGELAVKDLTALLSFLATPEDDLSLAAALRSPLFGWTENELFHLAHGRDKNAYLWNALSHADAPNTLEVLSDLRAQADFLRPYDLIDRILTRHDGRRRLTGRLGTEAEDGIDALLSQALAYERMDVPSLTGFLTWLAAEDVEIKRQMDTNPTEVRVMTVHGSKGLEAPVVILPDTGKRDLRGRGDLVSLNGNTVWKPRSEDMPEVLSGMVDALKDREREERMRLLYVAMTRAESWLTVAGAGEVAKEAADSWHQIVAAGLDNLPTKTFETPLGHARRYQEQDWPEPSRHEVAAPQLVARDLPDWAELPAPHLSRAPKPLVPSDLGGGKVVSGAEAGQDSDIAKRRGRQIHRLLEFLPSYPHQDWPHHAGALLAFGEDAAPPDELSDLLAEAQAVLTAEHLGYLFDGNALAEVAVSAPVDIAGRRRIHGVIDRLVITPERVLAVDFKSNLTVPDRVEDIPEGILRQLGAYETALSAIYPDREIVSAVLWTRQAQLMELPKDIALRAFGRLDAEPAAT